MQKQVALRLLPLLLSLTVPAVAADTPAAAASASAPAPAPTRAEVQDRLATALRSYSILMDENAQLKDAAEKSASEKSALSAQLDSAREAIAGLTARAAAANQLDSIKVQLRQAQDQIAALVAENSRLKLRLALQSRPPAGGLPVPTRPAQE